jgi:hypothetical protein
MKEVRKLKEMENISNNGSIAITGIHDFASYMNIIIYQMTTYY